MGKRGKLVAVTLVCLVACLCRPAVLAGDDFGMSYTLGVDKKLDKRLTLSAEGELRTRNDSRTLDRWSAGVAVKYKLTPWLKADAGYILLIDNNREKITYNLDGELNNWRPSYWGTRHRAYASLTASLKVSRVTFSLRERWQFTYRPAATTERYDFDNSWWEDTEVRAKNAHVLRSRLQVEYNIPKCKLTPWAVVELYNTLSLEKTRFVVGADYNITKRHQVEAFYRYQTVSKHGGSSETDMHLIGLGYTFKF